MSGTDTGAPRYSHVDESLDRVFAASDFVRQSCARDPALLAALASSGDLSPGRLARESVLARAPRWLPEALPSEEPFMTALRRWRRREMVRIAWRDLAGWADLAETLADLTAFADAAIATASRYAWQRLVERYGVPRSDSGAVQSLVVVAMGKLGGGELNFSSDIDLILLFPEHGTTSGVRSAPDGAVSNEEFFTRLGQLLIRLLDARTEEGIVVRVDVRLRPFGESGPLVVSFASLEDYLQRHGRDWERYAWIKARPVTAPERYAEIYAAAIRPFVYRRYLDYGVFESLREMTTRIEREVERRELADDVKLGPGGIREIEFIVQSLQLIRGGRDTRLQTPSLLQALALLDRHKLLSPGAVTDLQAAYAFLRRLENRLQMLADEQTHRLPRDDAGRNRIATAMGAPDRSQFEAQLEHHRARVVAHFRSVIFRAAPPHASATLLLELASSPNGSSAAATSVTTSLVERLRALGFGADAPEAARLLEELRDSSLARKLDEPGRRRLQALLAPLAASIGASRAPLAVLKRVLRILEAIGTRSAYFALLNESAEARRLLTELAAHGDFLPDQIASYPLLLDELVDERVLSASPTRAQLATELQLALQQARDHDAERQVEALRHFQRAAMFHVAVADLEGRLPVMRVSDRLTEIAELILESAMELASRQIAAQFGRAPAALCAVGYGKLGGFELGYASDLDLVFLHDSPSLDDQPFFLRFAQRIMHLLTMHSAAGRLYAVDLRLRPSGGSGPLVTSLRAFAEYQERSAWTWEHQALLHARAVAGAPSVRAGFERVRMDILRHHVRSERLLEDVRAMRERMRRELAKSRPGGTDLKHDAGGIADIEFLAQYWALRWARDYPPVAQFPDTIRQLESVASANLVSQRTVDTLTAAYRAYRTRAHHLSLEGRPAIVPADEFAAERAAVSAVWDAAMTPHGL
ncbi:MAG TPA: bifunctional [glutamate--ammonia ligase]-adenylyl-L-tyrosine phosphorylase/[glutamate--ammonia-ligase] adenylyltransferase [Steroidobacteraceae bacterium]|nr:bifunctional [glutamate--ammonia ligase]-adenylyl-L-tyrosine phosphorylase/[glutamate--ammonia-ligase] adenylyltransferase [Steroidobacteraceae bacterium]